ncbi:MAG: outer membrane lipoprotein-sorting protein [Candidatus Aminicenantes bacterium]|nr:outer membrane lipoprotein-sorting protein [Candidatus Aminicenantes bacterium]
MPLIKKIVWLLLPIFCLVVSLPAADAAMVLKTMEENTMGANAPRDMETDMVMTIQDGKNVRVREIHAWSRNIAEKDDLRVLKFIAPADVKDVGFLVLDQDSMYIYLPEFHRTRRIASSSKKDPFMGSDFSYEDMGTSAFSKYYDPRMFKESDGEWQLELLRKPGADKPYARIVLTVSKANTMPVRMELYDESGRLGKVAEETAQQVGKYWIMASIKMTHVKKGTSTLLEMRNIKVDLGLKDEIFSERFLKKRGS